MNWKHIVTVYLKELRDSLRDRRTLLSMIVIPTLVMPALILGVGVISFKTVQKARAEVPPIVVLGGEDSPAVREALAQHPKFRLVPPMPDWKQQIADKKVRAAAEIPERFDALLEGGQPAIIKIYNYGGEMRSNLAVTELRRFFTDYREQVVASRLAERGLPASWVKPFELRSENVAPPEKVGGNAFGGLVPYLFILLCFTGAMYPAMDLSAGEKERGTMETLLCSPVRRINLVLGKFLMVLTASLGTVAFSLLSMGLTFLIGGALLARRAGGAVGTSTAVGSNLPSIDPLGALAAVAMVFPTAVLFSAGLFAISLFAKSYKEAQSYTSPLIIVIILPAVMAMLPGVELSARLALVPILNVSLVSKELVSGVWHWHYIALIFASSCFYAAAALAFAVKMFNREGVIFRS